MNKNLQKQVSDAIEGLTTVRDLIQEAYDNLSESQQEDDTGAIMTEEINTIDSAIGELEVLVQ